MIFEHEAYVCNHVEKTLTLIPEDSIEKCRVRIAIEQEAAPACGLGIMPTNNFPGFRLCEVFHAHAALYTKVFIAVNQYPMGCPAN